MKIKIMCKLYKLDKYKQSVSFATVSMLANICEGNQYLHKITLSIGEEKKIIMSKTFTNEPKKCHAINEGKSKGKHRITICLVKYNL